MSIFSKSNSFSQYCRKIVTSSLLQLLGSEDSPHGRPLFTCVSNGDGGGWLINGLGYRHNKSGENGSGRGSRSMAPGRVIGGTFISSGGRVTAVRNRLLRWTAFNYKLS